MITQFNNFLITESMTHIDVSKLVTVTAINNDNEGNWIYTTSNGEFILLKEQAGKISLVDDKLANFVNTGHPIIKYFETEHDNNIILFAANVAADAVALNEGRVYLIERKDGRGWALPGGFIDPGENPEQAAIRELKEETLAKPKDIKSVRALGMIKANDPREINFYTFPFVIDIKSTAELKFGDDAKNGKWLLLNRAVKTDLAFTHHTEILKMVDY
jgi:ADP-ribose pyrophosphatase YjhB (NUDIX family)